jgi:hypothetical protein
MWREGIAVSEVFVLLLVWLVMSIMPPSPFVTSARGPIRTDTQYNEVATFLGERGDVMDNLVILTYSVSVRVVLG